MKNVIQMLIFSQKVNIEKFKIFSLNNIIILINLIGTISDLNDNTKNEYVSVGEFLHQDSNYFQNSKPHKYVRYFGKTIISTLSVHNRIN